MRPSPISLCLESLQLLVLEVKERGSDPQQVVVSLHQEEVEELHPLLGPAVAVGPEQDQEGRSNTKKEEKHRKSFFRAMLARCNPENEWKRKSGRFSIRPRIQGCPL